MVCDFINNTRIPHIRKLFNRNAILSKKNQPTMDMQMKQDNIKNKTWNELFNYKRMF